MRRLDADPGARAGYDGATPMQVHVVDDLGRGRSGPYVRLGMANSLMEAAAMGG